MSNSPDAKSTDLQISAHTSLDPFWPEFIDRPECPSHGRGRVEQVFGLTTHVRLVQKRGSFFAYGDQNPLEEVNPFTLGLWFSEERGSGGCCWGRFGDMPQVLGLSTGKDAVIEGVQGKVAMFGSCRHCPPLWFLFSTGFFPTWFVNYSGSMGIPADFCPWSGSGRADLLTAQVDFDF